MKTTFFVNVGIAAAIACAPALAQMGQRGEPVTRDQYIAAQKQRFTNMDANNDGVVTKDELSAGLAKRTGNAPPAAMVDAAFRMIDTDGDGKATAAEAEAAAGKQFDAWDTNKDGTLTPEERRAGMMAMMQRAQQPQ
jgi:Ca2+-binding EF-hand superfamily protein